MRALERKTEGVSALTSPGQDVMGTAAWFTTAWSKNSTGALNGQPKMKQKGPP